MLDEDGNLDVDENEINGTNEEGNKEGGWDVGFAYHLIS